MSAGAVLPVEHPRMIATFAAMVPLFAKLPWTVHPEEPGVILNADGHPIMTADTWGEHDDVDALALAQAVVTGVNTCAGYQPVETRTSSSQEALS